MKTILACNHDVTQHFRAAKAPNCVHTIVGKCLQYEEAARPTFDELLVLVDQARDQLNGKKNDWLTEQQKLEIEMKEKTYLGTLAADTMQIIMDRVGGNIVFHRPIQIQ